MVLLDLRLEEEVEVEEQEEGEIEREENFLLSLGASVSEFEVGIEGVELSDDDEDDDEEDLFLCLFFDLEPAVVLSLLVELIGAMEFDKL